MSFNTKRYIVPNDPQSKSPDEAQSKKAIRLSLELCEKHDITEITLFVAVKKNLPNTAIWQLFKNSFRQKLMNAKDKIPFDGQVSLNLHSLNTITKPGVSCELILAYNPFDKMLDCLDDIEAKFIVIIPFNMDSMSGWCEAWPVTVISGNKAQSPMAPTIIPLLEEAMLKFYELHSGIDTIFSIEKPVIYAYTKGMFDKLSSAGIYPTQEEIRQSAIRNGWEAKHARALGDKFGLR